MKKTMVLSLITILFVSFLAGCEHAEVKDESVSINELKISKVSESNYSFSNGKQSGQIVYGAGTVDLKIGNDFKVIMNSITRSVGVFSRDKAGIFLKVNAANSTEMSSNVMLLASVFSKIEELNPAIVLQYDSYVSTSSKLRPSGVSSTYEFCSGFGANESSASDRSETGSCVADAKKDGCKQVGDTDCACAMGDFLCYCTTTWKCN